MTREEILAMQPGRELNALVAEKVMGYESGTATLGGWHPSTDLSAAWEVVEKMRELFSKRQKFNDAMYEIMHINVSGVKIHPIEVIWYMNPLNICKAALLAVMEC